MRAVCFIDEVAYRPVPPTPDTAELAEASARVFLRHKIGERPEILIVPKGEMSFGWVIGICEVLP